MLASTWFDEHVICLIVVTRIWFTPTIIRSAYGPLTVFTNPHYSSPLIDMLSIQLRFKIAASKFYLVLGSSWILGADYE